MPSASWLNGWLTGDIVTAAEYRKSVGSVFDSTLGVAAATIDITSIPASYAHLIVVLYGRGDTAATNTNVSVQFNGDTGANYDRQSLIVAAAVATASEAFAGTSALVGSVPAASAAANIFGGMRIQIDNYANASNNKVFSAFGSVKIGTTSGNITMTENVGAWRSNAAINRVTLLPGAGNFAAGTRATVYVMGA